MLPAPFTLPWTQVWFLKSSSFLSKTPWKEGSLFTAGSTSKAFESWIDTLVFLFFGVTLSDLTEEGSFLAEHGPKQ